MIKVMWLIKRADHLSMEEFERWWTEKQAPDIRDEQVPASRALHRQHPRRRQPRR